MVTGLKDVVVVGYGIQSRKTIAGSATTIDAKQIEAQVSNNVGQVLQGTVAGLTVNRSSGDPASSYNIVLRGLSSISNPASPLILIDGVQGNLADVSGDMIQSITVLKDATTAGIYGSSSAGGVILVTTKNGSGRQKLNLTYNVGVSGFANLIKELRGDDLMRLQNEALVNSGSQPIWTPHQIDSVGAGTNWVKAVTRTGIRHELNLDYSGGNSALNYLLSANYLREDAAVIGNWYEKAVSRIKLNAQTTSWLNLGLNVQNSYTRGRAGASLVGAGSYTPNILQSKGGLPNLGIPSAAQVVSGGVNPIMSQEDSIAGYSNYNPTYGLNAFFTPQITFSKHLKFNSIINWGITSEYSKVFYGSYNVYDASHTVLMSQRLQANTAASAAQSTGINEGYQNYLTYTDTINGVHSINIVAGNRTSKNGIGSVVSEAIYGFSNNLLQNINNGSNRSSATGHDYTPTTKRSYFGRATYSYKERYIAEATLSYDGTDRFGPNNKYGYFPAVALAWRASEENFLKGKTWADNLKIRASYGVLGNDAIPQFEYYQTITVSPAYAFGAPNYQAVQGAFPTSVANPNVKWESTATLDLGFDWTFMRHWNVVFDYYNRNTSNMLYYAPISQTTGFINEYLNVGNVDNKGIELALGYNNKWGDWRFNANLTLAHNRNAVTKLFNGLTQYIEDNVYGNALIVGQPTTMIYGVKVLGVYQNAADLVKHPRKGASVGDYIFADLNHDSLVSGQDYQPIGNTFPKLTAGLSTGLSYKGVDLQMTMSGAFDYDVLNQGAAGQVTKLNFTFLNANEHWLDFYNNRWHGPGTSNTMPRLVANSTINSIQGIRSVDLENGNYWRIRNIQLGYTLGSKVATKVKLQSLRVYLNVSNPLLISKFYGYDPETSGYPIMRTASFGLNANF
jgi:TonB-linked SusC/RagA family outer membrane protein